MPTLPGPRQQVELDPPRHRGCTAPGSRHTPAAAASMPSRSKLLTPQAADLALKPPGCSNAATVSAIGIDPRASAADKGPGPVRTQPLQAAPRTPPATPVLPGILRIGLADQRHTLPLPGDRRAQPPPPIRHPHTSRPCRSTSSPDRSPSRSASASAPRSAPRSPMCQVPWPSCGRAPGLSRHASSASRSSRRKLPPHNCPISAASYPRRHQLGRDVLRSPRRRASPVKPPPAIEVGADPNMRQPDPLHRVVDVVHVVRRPSPGPPAFALRFRKLGTAVMLIIPPAVPQRVQQRVRRRCAARRRSP